MPFTLSSVSLRHALPVLFFLLVAIPAGGIGVLLSHKAWDRELQTVQDQHLQLARHMAGVLTRYAEDVEATFRLTAFNVADAMPVRELTAMLERLHLQHICIVDSAGHVERQISPRHLVLERVPATLLETLRALETTATRFPVFSNVLPDASDTPTIFLWQPLGNGRYAWSALQTAYFMQLQSTIHFGRQGHAVIVDRSGRVLAHPNTQWQAARRDLSQLDPVRRMLRGETGVSRFFSPALQADMIAGFTTTPSTGWGVMIPQPLAELEAHVTQVQRAAWAVIGAALLGATLLGGLVSRCLAAPLQCIGAVARQFANGSYDARVGDLGPFHTREAAQLAAQFNAMADEVNHSGRERVAAEARWRQAQQEVERRQAQKMEAIGTLAGGIAHDFNNILTAILGYTELSLHNLSDRSRVQQNLQLVLAAGRRAKELVQQILTFSRESEPERKPLHIHLVVQEALKLLRASLPTTITIRQDIDEGVGTALANPTQIHQVLLNLCANAEYAMRETGGVLAVGLHALESDATLAARDPALHAGPYIRLTIRDTGPGMPPEILARIFEPFFTTKGRGHGTGMGLAVVHGIVTSHGGEIVVESTPGQGTMFAIYFPRLDTPAEAEPPAEESLRRGEGTILFIDDEATLACWAHEILISLGYNVVAQTNSLEALEAFRLEPTRFDLVITDQTMPYMTGEGLVRELRRIRSDIPIILCTGFSHTMDAEKAAAQGLDAFLMKPLTAVDLSLTIRRVLAQRAERVA